MGTTRFATGPRPRTLAAVVYNDGSRHELNPEEAERVRLALGDDSTLTPNEAAVILGVSRPMVLRWLKQSVLPDVPVGAHHRIPRQAVLDLKERRSQSGRDSVATVKAAKSNKSAARRTAIAAAAARAQIAERDA